MERKLVQHGNSTLMVSLPKKWSKNQSLKKGDTVNVTTIPDKVIITTKERKEELKEIQIHLEKSEYEDIRSLLGKYYREGIQKITITYNNPKAYYMIDLITKSLQGFEIINHEDKKITIKNVTKELSVDTNELLSKISNITNLQFLLVKEYLQNGEKNKLEEVRSIRDDCWKFRNMLYVHLKESLLFSAFDDYFLAHLIEYNASFLYWLYKSFDKSNITKPSKELLSLFDQVHEYYKTSMKMVKEKEKSYIVYIQTKKYELFNECEEYIVTNAKDKFLIIYLSMLIQNIHNPKSIIV